MINGTNTYSSTSANKALALGAVSVQGELKKWHKITLLIEGPNTSETNGSNPFLNYRLNVTFTNGSKKYVVPGYFAADGNAGNTGAAAGNSWKVHFAPDQTGTWTYAISMRSGTNIAVSTDANAGNAVSNVNGKTGSFTVSGSDKTGSDLRAKGRLNYVGAHYLQFAETGEYFVKGGVDSPENFLAYDDFDNTPDNGGKRKSWSPHVKDWRSGDPTWKSTKGKGIIGAINYLASEGLNAFSFLTMNIAGDDKNVYPYVSSSDYTRFDCSKLDQWEVVFNHADKLGLYLHFKLQERENCKLLDGGNLGVQRKVYFRELIARFGHHLALNWNLGEENIQTTQQRKDMAAYVNTIDPYNHHIVLHTNVKEQTAVYTPLLGSASKLTGVSIQTDWNNVYNETRLWVQNSTNAGKKWIVANDEQNAMGVACDANYSGNRGSLADNQNDIRKQSLWGNLIGGGAGVEYYFGGATGHTDLAAEDFRSRAKMWRFNRHALNFFKNLVPLSLTELKPLSNVNRGWSLGKDGQVYIVYLKDGGSANITLSNGNYTVQWYDPRNGGSLQKGSVSNLSGSGTKSIGNPPNSSGEDWVVLIKAGGLSQPQPSSNTPPVLATIGNQTMNEGSTLNVALFATDPNGDNVTITATNLPSFARLNNNTLTFTPGNQDAGTYTITVRATDSKQATDQETFTIVVKDGASSGQTVTHFTLVNADKDQDIKVLSSGEQLNLASLPTRNLNIRVNTSPSTVGSVKLVLSGKQSRNQTETGAPYALFGDRDGDYNNWTPAVGSYTLKATPYSGAGATGTAGTPLTISFSVINQSSSGRAGAIASAEDQELEVLCYPNPFQQAFTLKLTGSSEGKLPLFVYDGHGRLVFELPDCHSEQEINPGHQLAPGLYVLQIGEGQRAKRYKLVKQP
ncbi:DUF5060 domain-containing protein [Larkinella arboricola]|uniref:DUF5060 domain-containing protein n=1 Tax=Larkinella arboricola TaxID=643671 RepID=UPI001B85F487|nr:DUF5060 domain-containing protein [Larkinella arboricola]